MLTAPYERNTRMAYIYGFVSGKLGVQRTLKKNTLTSKHKTGHYKSQLPGFFFIHNILKQDLSSGLSDYNVQSPSVDTASRT